MLLVSFVHHEVKPVLKVNLRKDPGHAKVVKARVVDKKIMDNFVQKQQMLEAQKREELLAEQLQAEEALAKAEAAKKAMQEKLRLEQEQKMALQAKKEQDLARKKLEQQQLQKQKIAQQKLAQEQQKIAQQKAQQQAAAKQKEAALKAERDKLAAEHQEFLLTEVEKYRIAFQELIEENRILSAVFPNNISCKIRIKLLPDGSILSVTIVQTSGNPAYDELATTAIYKSAPFPMPSEPDLYTQLRDIILSFKNGEQSSDVL